MRRLIPLALLLIGVGVYVGYHRYLASLPYEWSGTVNARTMDVGSRVGGRIAQIHVREGDNVKAGDPLLELEPADLPAQRLQAQGQLTQAQAGLERIVARNTMTARQAEVAAAQARLQAETANLERAQTDNDRMVKLFAGGAATVADRDNAGIALRNAKFQVTALSATLAQLVSGTPQDVRAAQGAVDVAQGRLQQVEVMLAELVVRAPQAARVEVLDLRPGDILAANATAARLLEPTELYVRIYVPETQIGLVQPGLKLPLYVDSFPERAFEGVVEFISDEGEYSPRNLQTADERADQVFAARVRLENGGGALRAGMAAFARLQKPAS